MMLIYSTKISFIIKHFWKNILWNFIISHFRKYFMLMFRLTLWIIYFKEKVALKIYYTFSHKSCWFYFNIEKFLIGIETQNFFFNQLCLEIFCMIIRKVSVFDYLIDSIITLNLVMKQGKHFFYRNIFFDVIFKLWFHIFNVAKYKLIICEC